MSKLKFSKIAFALGFVESHCSRMLRTGPAGQQKARVNSAAEYRVAYGGVNTRNLLINSVGTVNNAATMSIMRPAPIAGRCN